MYSTPQLCISICFLSFCLQSYHYIQLSKLLYENGAKLQPENPALFTMHYARAGREKLYISNLAGVFFFVNETVKAPLITDPPLTSTTTLSKKRKKKKDNENNGELDT